MPCKPCANCGNPRYIKAWGLCDTCYRISTVKEKYRTEAVARTPHLAKIKPRDSIDQDSHAVAAKLELLGGLLHRRTQLGYEEWERLLSPLSGRHQRVVILRFIHGLTEDEIGERLETSRQRVDQLLSVSYHRLRKHVAKMLAVQPEEYSRCSTTR